MSIHLQNVTKRFDKFIALDRVSLTIASGELVALLGPSGSGKTTLLRIIAGLEFAEEGSVFFDGEDTQHKSASNRNVGFVFQHYALFRHMTVFENVAFGLRVRPRHARPSRDAIKKKVMDLLDLVHLNSFCKRYPSELSGGQRQRVALARALAVEPKVLLLDEPFGALDAKVRKELRSWMRRLHDEIHLTSVFVTHDQEEAMEVSDRIVVMSNGRIEQVGTPKEVWKKPANSFVYDFLGNYNVFDGWEEENGTLRFITQRSFIKSNLNGQGKQVKLYARPHEMQVSKSRDEENCIKTRVVHINPTGSLAKIEAEREEGPVIQIEIPEHVVDEAMIQKGDILYVKPIEEKCFRVHTN